MTRLPALWRDIQYGAAEVRRQPFGVTPRHWSAFPGPEQGVNDPYLAEYLQAAKALTDRSAQDMSQIEALAYRDSVLSILFVADALRAGDRYELDLEKAEGWYSRAASLGSGRAMYGIGCIHVTKGAYAEAVAAFEVGAERNCGAAMWALGLIYSQGGGVPVDRERAIACWELGSRSGHVWSRRSLSRALIGGGQGVAAQAKGYALLASALVSLTYAVLVNKTDAVMT